MVKDQEIVYPNFYGQGSFSTVQPESQMDEQERERILRNRMIIGLFLIAGVIIIIRSFTSPKAVQA